MDALFWIALGTLAVWIVAAVELVVGNRSLARLRDVDPELDREWPRLSVVIAARNEAADLEPALRTVLAQDYESLEILLVNDRSTDATGRIADRMADCDARLRVLHLMELPDGWLGKNHALHRGAQVARGRILLFTDADVEMRPGSLRRAVAHLERQGLDHLAGIPELANPGALLEAVTGAFKLMFGLFYKPWRAADPKSDRFVGTGAFNMVRAPAYRAVGGHAPIALYPDDDVMLGRLLKRAGYRQAPVLAPDFLRVQWYAGLGQMVKGLEKNSFAAVDYSLARLGGGTLLVLGLVAWPVAALFVTGGATLWLNVAVLAVMLGAYADNARFYGGRPAYAPVAPFAALFFLWVGWRAALLALVRGHIIWRDTAYPLEALRRARD